MGNAHDDYQRRRILCRKNLISPSGSEMNSPMASQRKSTPASQMRRQSRWNMWIIVWRSNDGWRPVGGTLAYTRQIAIGYFGRDLERGKCKAVRVKVTLAT